MEDFKDSSNYVEAEKKNDNSKVNSSSLWGEQEKNFLEDVTMNLVGDDEGKNLKGQKAMKWDPKKKKY